jgi:hypothetical protein
MRQTEGQTNNQMIGQMDEEKKKEMYKLTFGQTDVWTNKQTD